MTNCCVLIPYYNDGKNLISSLESIDVVDSGPDVVVVDDGSQEKASVVLQAYTGTLSVKLITLAENKGIETALNTGLQYCLNNYDYIARLDCGDICKNKRISKQIDFLNSNPEHGLVGSWVDFVTENGEYIFTSKLPSTHNEIKRKMFLNSMFVHPSVMIRSKVLLDIGLYPLDRPAAEDFALFFKIVKKYKTANLPEPLLNYVFSPTSISSKKRKIQIKSRIKILLDNFELGFIPLYGLVRSVLLLASPRSLTVKLRKYLIDY